MKLNRTELRWAISRGYEILEDCELKLIANVEAAKRRDDQEKLIESFSVTDESVLEWKAMEEENTRLSNIVSELLKDVEIGDE